MTHVLETSIALGDCLCYVISASSLWRTRTVLPSKAVRLHANGRWTTRFSPEHKVIENKAAVRRAFGRRYFDNPSIHTLKVERPAKGWAGPPGGTVMASLGRIPIGTRDHVRSCRAASPRLRPKSSRQAPASCRKRPRQWSDGRGFCHDLDSAPTLRMSAPSQIGQVRP